MVILKKTNKNPKEKCLFLVDKLQIMLSKDAKLIDIIGACLNKPCRYIKEDCYNSKCMHCTSEYIGWKDGNNEAHFCGIFNIRYFRKIL